MRLVLALGTRHASARLVRRYYEALQAEDYSEAFQCLSPAMETSEGRSITQAWLTETEGAHAAGGRVTGHAIINLHITGGIGLFRIPSKASFTVKVTRGERSYVVYPRAQKANGLWTIVAFDPGQLILEYP